MPTTELTQRSTLTHPLRLAIGYAGAALAALLLWWWYQHYGATLLARSPLPGQALFGSTAQAHAANNLLHMLLALAVIIVAARALGALLRRFGQPPVIGEIIAGILLGPSLLGLLWPQAAAFVLPPSIAPLLGIFAQIGVILYMFLVGVELNPAHVRRCPGTVLAISHSSILFPFLLGSVLAVFLYPRYATSDVPFGVFLLFIGISMSVTAFPVLARILTDRGMQHSRLGAIALACAAVDDVTAWCALAFVVSVAKMNMGDAVHTLALSVLFVGFVMLVLRRLVNLLVARVEARGQVGESMVALVLTGLLLAALTAEWIGIHALFGAFLFGSIIGHDSTLARQLVPRVRDLTVVLFLPAYFAYTGMRTQIGLVDGLDSWLMVGLIILVASVGKFGGSLVAARLTGLSWHQGAAIGILMNTRGLMEIVVLNIGLELKVLSPTLFAMMVLMAIVTTLATTPALNLLNRHRPQPGGAEPVSIGTADAHAPAVRAAGAQAH